MTTDIESLNESASLGRASLSEWQSFVESHPDATPFHHQHWLELLTEQYRSTLDIPAIFQGGRIVAAVPFIKTRTLRGAKKLVALPFTDCVRVLAVDQASREHFRRRISEQAYPGYLSVSINTDRPLFSKSVPNGTLRHELTFGPENFENAFPSALKRNLRTAVQHGLRFHWSVEMKELDTFFALHLKTRQRQGVPIQPKSFFRRFYAKMMQTGLAKIGWVEKDGQPIAAAAFLNYKDTMIYKYGASDTSKLQYRPNEFLMVKAIRNAHDLGIRRFDFGTSERSQEGLRRFKRKLGGEEIEMYTDCVSGAETIAARDSRAVELASLAIRHSPSFVCRFLGELLYRFSQ